MLIAGVQLSLQKPTHALEKETKTDRRRMFHNSLKAWDSEKYST